MMKPNWNGMRNIRTRPQVLEQIFSMNRRPYLQPKGAAIARRAVALREGWTHSAGSTSLRARLAANELQAFCGAS